MRKSTVVFSIIVTLLLLIIGLGIWMVSNRQVPKTTQDTNQTRTLTMNEVSQHTSKDDCWTVISGDVYDLTPYINRHPGGEEILRACGADSTTLFRSRTTDEGQPIGSGAPHSQTANDQLKELNIGTLVKE